MKKIGLYILIAVFLITSHVYAADTGKIAVAAEGKAATTEVSRVAARSPYFLFFDWDGKLLESVENPYKAARRRAGTAIVPFLAQKGATFVVAGRFGENMIRAMKAKGIEYLEFQGNAEAAFKKVLEERK
jgi:predicted Fe-Mo cluster-binding NifX family protein